MEKSRRSSFSVHFRIALANEAGSRRALLRALYNNGDRARVTSAACRIVSLWKVIYGTYTSIRVWPNCICGVDILPSELLKRRKPKEVVGGHPLPAMSSPKGTSGMMREGVSFHSSRGFDLRDSVEINSNLTLFENSPFLHNSRTLGHLTVSSFSTMYVLSKWTSRGRQADFIPSLSHRTSRRSPASNSSCRRCCIFSPAP
jgi:hypothetical protein